MSAKIEIIDVEKQDNMQIIIGHAGFIKTAEDLYEAMKNSVPGVKFGLAFAEASGSRLVRSEGNDDELKSLAEKNTLKIASGHTFVIIFRDAYPINVVKSIRDVPEVAEIYCATANPVKVIRVSDVSGSAIIGIIDGANAVGIESDSEREQRRKMLRDIGYKM
ncbi:MAG: adenosine-specific kinase [Candidatus Micrarchaeia archaeon]